MELFKLISIIFMITTSIILYQLLKDRENIEKFENSGVGTDTTTAITNLGKIAAQLLAGGATVPGNLMITGNTAVTGGLNLTGAINQGGLTIKQGTASPDGTKIQWGDGTGWRLRFQKDDKNPVMDVYDNGVVGVQNQLIVKGRDILAELDALKASTIKDQDTIDLRLTKGFNPDGGLSYTASTSQGDTMWVAGWGQNGNSLMTSKNPNSFVAQWRILRNNK
jgi:hypothetical protein